MGTESDLNPFQVIGLFLYPLKTGFLAFFRGYRKNSGMKWLNYENINFKRLKTFKRLFVLSELFGGIFYGES